MKRSLLAGAFVAALVLPSFGQSKDIVQTAMGAPQFSMLVKAVKAAGLVSTLKGKGPFTVFAPTNAAFAKVPKSLLAKAMKDKRLLKKILLYHVVPMEVMAADAKTMKCPTASGEMAQVTVMNGMVHVDNAMVIKADIKASNGVIHAIDKVLLPPSVRKMLMMKKRMPMKMGMKKGM